MKLQRRNLYIAGAVVLALFLFGNEGFRTVVSRYRALVRQNSRIEYLKKENALLRGEIYFLENDPSYIEFIARKELGLVSQDEVEYRFGE